MNLTDTINNRTTVPSVVDSVFVSNPSILFLINSLISDGLSAYFKLYCLFAPAFQCTNRQIQTLFLVFIFKPPIKSLFTCVVMLTSFPNCFQNISDFFNIFISQVICTDNFYLSFFVLINQINKNLLGGNN